MDTQIHVVLEVVAGQRALHSRVQCTGAGSDLDNGQRVVHGYDAAQRLRPANSRNHPFRLGPVCSRPPSVRDRRAPEKAER